MNKEYFIQILENPSGLNSETKSELKSIASHFPYFQTGRILYLLNLFQEKDILFDENFKLTAVYAADRKRLFQLLKNNYQTKIETKKTITESFIPEKESIAPLTKIETISESENLSPTIEITKEPKHIIIEEAIEPVLNTVEKEQPIVSNEFQTNEDAFEKEMLSWVLSSSFSLNDLPEIESEEILEVEIQPEKISLPQPEINKIEIPEKSSFSDWLNLISNEKEIVIENKPAQKIPEPIEKEVSKKVETKKNLKNQLDIIDKFMNSSSVTAPKKAEFYKPEVFAQRSVEDDEEIVTETLARIYEAQGNKTKAINIYEKLILKYPQKKDYFAALILKIKEE